MSQEVKAIRKWSIRQFGQLVEYSTINIFLEKSYTKCGGKLVPDPFLKYQNWACLWINNLEFYIYSLFLLYVKIRSRLYFNSYWNIFKLSCRSLAFTSCKAFSKNKKRSGTSLPGSLSAWFWRKIFLLLYSINWPNFIVWLLLLREILVF